MCGSAWPPSAAMVALRKESVDRNAVSELVLENVLASLSARRAWIEIAAAVKGGVTDGSLSARRAWIEIKVQPQTGQRNRRRSPQGEYGMFLFLTVQGGFVHADIRFNFKNCYSKKLSHKII